MPRPSATPTPTNQPAIQISDPVLDAVKAVDERIGKFAKMFNWVVTKVEDPMQRVREALAEYHKRKLEKAPDLETFF